MIDPELTRRSSWGQYGDSKPLSRGEFYARLDIINSRFEEFDNRMRQVESTVYAPRNFLLSLFSSMTGRIFLIIVSLLIAWVLGTFGLNPIRAILGDM